jgi:ribonuclease T2
VPLDPTVRFFFFGFLAFVTAAVLSPSRADVPGDFDFYVLALSWSPTHCDIEGNPNSPQCRAGTFGFVVHGLWPQYERGYPENCRTSEGRWVSDAIVASMRDIMPSGGLIGSQWRKHGACSGLNQSGYFELVRDAYDTIRIPNAYQDPATDLTLSPGAVETAFIDANPGLSSGGIAVTCRQNALFEVRICLTKDLDFRNCQEVNRKSCRASRIDVPAID